MFGRKDLEAKIRLELENEILKDRVKELQAEKTDLQAQIMSLQDALISKESPQYYEDRRQETVSNDPAVREKMEQSRAEIEFYDKYVATLDSDNPFISTVDDLQAMLSRTVGPPDLSEPLRAGETEG